MCFLRQRARSPRIAFLQRRTRTIHEVADLPHRLLLSRVQRASRQLFQLFVGRAQQLFRVLALTCGFCGRYIGRNLRRGLARSALANDNLPRSAIRRRRCALAVFSGSARRTSIRLFLCYPLRCFLARSRRGLCRNLLRGSGLCARLLRGSLLCRSRGCSRSLSGGIRGACRVLLPGSHSRSRETQPKRYRESAGKPHNSAKTIVSHPNKERKGRVGQVLRAPPYSRGYLENSNDRDRLGNRLLQEKPRKRSRFPGE